MAEAIVKDANLVIDQKAFTQMIGSLESINKSIQSMGSVTERSNDKLDKIEENTEETEKETEKSGGALSRFINFMQTADARESKAKKAAAGALKTSMNWAKSAFKSLKRGFLGSLLAAGGFGLIALLLKLIKDINFEDLKEDLYKFMEEWWPGFVGMWENVMAGLEKIDGAYEYVLAHVGDIYDWFHAFNRASIALPLLGKFLKGGKGILGALWGIQNRTTKIFSWFTDLFKTTGDVDDVLKNKKISDIPIKKRVSNFTKSVNNFVGDTFRNLNNKFKDFSKPKALDSALELDTPKGALNKSVTEYNKTVKKFTSAQIDASANRLQELLKKPGALRTADEVFDINRLSKITTEAVPDTPDTPDTPKRGNIFTKIKDILDNNIFGKNGIISSAIGTTGDLGKLGMVVKAGEKAESLGGLSPMGKGLGLIKGIGNVINAFLPFKWIFRPFAQTVFTVIDAVTGALNPESVLGAPGEMGRKYGVTMKKKVLKDGTVIEVPDPTGLERGLGAITGVAGGFIDLAGMIMQYGFGKDEKEVKQWTENFTKNVGQFFLILAKSDEVFADLYKLFNFDQIEEEIESDFMIAWDKFLNTWRITTAKLQLNLMEFGNTTADALGLDEDSFIRSTEAQLGAVRSVIDQGTGLLKSAERLDEISSMLRGELSDDFKEKQLQKLLDQMPKTSTMRIALESAQVLGLGDNIFDMLGGSDMNRFDLLFRKDGAFDPEAYGKTFGEMIGNEIALGRDENQISNKMEVLLRTLDESLELTKVEKAAARQAAIGQVTNAYNISPTAIDAKNVTEQHNYVPASTYSPEMGRFYSNSDINMIFGDY